GVIGTTLLMAVAFELAVFGWFAHAIEVYTGTPEIVALVLLVVMAPLLQPQLLALALARHVAPRPRAAGGGGPLAGAVAWVGTEWACPKLFGDTLGYGLWPCAWMRQAADVAGVPGLTLALLLGNECALAAARALAGAEPRRAVVPTAGLVTLVLALSGDGALRERTFAAHPPGDAPARAGIVQADIARYGPLAARRGTFGAVRTILDAYFVLSAKLLRRSPLDLIVWPETVYPTTFGSPKSAEGAAFDRDIARFVARNGVPLVF